MELDWLVIGGGIHGVHLAVRLLGEAKVRQERLRIVDPAPWLLARWRECTATTGMTHLRSTSVHHLDLSPQSLQRFAAKRRKRTSGLFAPPYRRPALELFNDHCDDLIARYALKDLHIQNRVVSCALHPERRARLDGGEEIHARNFILALGTSERPYWPSWSPAGHARVHHIFDQGFDGWPLGAPETVAVVGGGISASQVALRLVGEGHRVALIRRHPLREHQFDSDPGWLGPKNMAAFSRERDVERRRTAIAKARHRGSVSPDVRRDLARAIEHGHLCIHESQVERVNAGTDGLQLQLENEVVHADRLLLATGFATERPGGRWVEDLVRSSRLPCAKCSYPVLDTHLRWSPGLFVTGPLAELELGPASRNIAGARRAGDRIVAASKLA